MNMTKVTANCPTTCWRCNVIGLPDYGIAIGEEYIRIEMDDAITVEAACMDCFNRIKEEAGQL